MHDNIYVKNYEIFRPDQPTTHEYFTRQIMVNKFKFFFLLRTSIKFYKSNDSVVFLMQ